MTQFVGLIRGVNVGGKGKVPMPELRAGLAEVGLSDVSTYINSGNVIAGFDGDAPGFEELIEELIERDFGFRPVVVARTADQLAAARDRHPFADRTDDGAKLHVLFCKRTPDPAGLAAIDHARFAPDLLAADGDELFAYYPTGAGRSKLTLDPGTIGTEATARNLKTVAKLVELAG